MEMDWVALLPHVNASLNGVSAALLCTGWLFARAGRERRHRACMVSAFACSVVFLAFYLMRMALGGHHVYPDRGLERDLYLGLLATHVVLAALVPWLAMRTLYLALRGRTASHRKWARITLPIWLYVSLTGVLVYWMLYHLAGLS